MLHVVFLMSQLHQRCIARLIKTWKKPHMEEVCLVSPCLSTGPIEVLLPYMWHMNAKINECYSLDAVCVADHVSRPCLVPLNQLNQRQLERLDCSHGRIFYQLKVRLLPAHLHHV